MEYFAVMWEPKRVGYDIRLARVFRASARAKQRSSSSFPPRTTHSSYPSLLPPLTGFRKTQWMTKPTLLQTILNRPSQSYAFPPEKSRFSKPQETPRVAINLGQSIPASIASSSLNTSGCSPSRRREDNPGVGVSPRSSGIEIQGSATHVSSSSHASRSTLPSPVSTATSFSSPYFSSPPPPPPKERVVSEPLPRLKSSRNLVLNPNQGSQLRRDAAADVPTQIQSGAPSPDRSQTEEDDGDDEESTQDVFYTPNSSPRASLASSISIPMSYATAATTTAPRKVSRRSLRGNPVAPERSPSHRTINETPEGATNMPRQGFTSTASLKANPNNNPALTASKGPPARITSTEATFSRAPAPTSLSPPSSARIAVSSTRTPSRSSSLNKGRPTADPRSGPSATATGGQGHGQAVTQLQSRAMATVSTVSSTSSMSSNSLNGHSVVFSDLVTETTRATTPLANGASIGSGSKKEYGSMGSDATRRWVDKSASDTLRVTTTPMSSNPSISISQPKRRPTKSHTYQGLGVASASHPPKQSTSTSGNPGLYQRSRDTKSQSVMMSMTAVLEAAEQEEFYRHEIKRGGGGSSAWKARQVLKEHRNTGKNAVLGTGLGVGTSAEAGTGNGVGIGLKGKGKEKAVVDTPVGAEIQGDAKGKGKERKRDPSIQYFKHQPLTSSPLAMSSKPLPAPGSPPPPPPPRNNSFLEIPVLKHPGLGHRRSRSLGAESVPMYQRSESPTSSRLPGTSASHMHMDSSPPRVLGHGRANSISHSHTSSSATSANNGTVDLTALPRSSGELPSKGTAGYISLVLPRAPPPLNLDPNANPSGLRNGGLLIGGGDGKVDLTRDGLAQTTMASVEVVRGLGGSTGRKGLIGMLQLPLVRRKTIPASIGFGLGTGVGEKRSGGIVCDAEGNRGAGVAGTGSVLGFTNHRKPPEYVPSGSVLVQVWAVGVDGVDGRLVGVRMVNGASVDVNAIVPSSTGTTASADHGPQRDEESKGLERIGVTPEDKGRQEDTVEGLEKGRPNVKGAGLGRSLSLRERLSRSVSLGRSAGKEFLQQRRREHSPDKRRQHSPLNDSLQSQSARKQDVHPPLGGTGSVTMPGIGLIPGRSFVGRVVECGWEVRGDVVRKGDWVAGLLDIKKCGALTEFIIVDRHRVHRVPHPKLSNTPANVLSSLTFSSSPPSPSSSTFSGHSLTLEELALLPLCGVPAYRAVRTYAYAFSSMRDNPSISPISRSPDRAKNGPLVDSHTPSNSYGTKIPRLNLGDHENGRRRRALVLRGHDGIGAMALQMLVLRGWRVCVHVPFIASPPNVPTTAAVADGFMEEVEERIRKWGAEEVIFDDGEVVGMDEGRGAVVRVVDGLREDGDAFDAVLDTVGGKEVREAAERLLRSLGRRMDSGESDIGGGRNGKDGARGMGQFTTVVGDSPERVIPSAGDLFRAGLRSLKFGTGSGGSSSVLSTEKGSSESVNTRNDSKAGKVGYAWVNLSQDVDWEGKDVGDTIGALVELALEYGIKPWVGAEYAIANDTGRSELGTPNTVSISPPAETDVAARLEPGHWEGKRIVPFEKAPDIFVDGGPLTSGGTVVVKIAT